MADFKVDKDGFLLDAEGNRLKLNDDEVRAEGFMPQDQIDNKIQERLARQKADYEKQLKNLEAQANRTPELQQMLDETKANLDKVSKDLEKAKEDAHKQVAQQMSELKTRAEQAETKLQETEQAWLNEQISNAVLSNVTDPESGKQLFVNPKEDVVPRLLQVHKREKARNEDGEVIEGQFVDMFEVEVYDSESKTSKKQQLPVDKAIKAFASNPKNRHYLNGNSSGGPAQYSQPGGKLPGVKDGEVHGVSRIAAGLKRGDMKNMPSVDG